MNRKNRLHRSLLSAHRRLLEGHDDDPLSGVANLFDVAMVFAIALLLALVTHYRLPELLSAQQDVTILKNPGAPNMEIIRRRGRKLEHYRITRETLGGEGQRLGTAYRLRNGEVVYVPDEPGASLRSKR